MTDQNNQSPNNNQDDSNSKSQSPDFDQEKFAQEVSEKAAILAAERNKIDEEKIVSRAKEEARKEIVDKIAGKQEVDEDAPAWVKRGESRPSSWDELLKESEARAEKRFAAREKTREEKRKEQEQKEIERKAKNAEEWNKIWDQQLDDLEKSGKLPKIDDEIKKKVMSGQELTDEEKQDPGLIARNSLQQMAVQHKESNLKAAYLDYYLGSEQEREASSQAPVFGSRKAAVSNRGGEFTYEEIHNTGSYEELLENE